MRRSIDESSRDGHTTQIEVLAPAYVLARRAPDRLPYAALYRLLRAALAGSSPHGRLSCPRPAPARLPLLAPARSPGWQRLIRLKRIYNFLCSMLLL
jgi:hypothetical protein